MDEDERIKQKNYNKTEEKKFYWKAIDLKIRKKVLQEDNIWYTNVNGFNTKETGAGGIVGKRNWI